MTAKVFNFRSFSIKREKSGMKLSTDAVLLGAWTADLLQNENPLRILDIGTGTGILALIAVQFFERACVDAIDSDDGAVFDAGINFSESPYADRLRLMKADVRNFCRKTGAGNNGLREGQSFAGKNIVPEKVTDHDSVGIYDLIICNPPYFDFSVPLSSIARHNARCSDSLSAADLFASVSRLMTECGRACIIIPYDRESDYVRTALDNGLTVHRCVRVSSKKEKSPYVTLLCFVKKSQSDADASLCNESSADDAENRYLLEDDGSRSEFFRNITKELYLK